MPSTVSYQQHLNHITMLWYGMPPMHMQLATNNISTTLPCYGMPSPHLQLATNNISTTLPCYGMVCPPHAVSYQQHLNHITMLWFGMPSPHMQLATNNISTTLACVATICRSCVMVVFYTSRSCRSREVNIVQNIKFFCWIIDGLNKIYYVGYFIDIH